MKEIVDDDFKFDEIGRNLSKWVEFTEGKGEIAHYQKNNYYRHVKSRVCLGKV